MTGDISSLIPTEAVETATRESENTKQEETKPVEISKPVENVKPTPTKATPAKDEFLDLLLDRISPVGSPSKLPPLK